MLFLGLVIYTMWSLSNFLLWWSCFLCVFSPDANWETATIFLILRVNLGFAYILVPFISSGRKCLFHLLFYMNNVAVDDIVDILR